MFHTSQRTLSCKKNIFSNITNVQEYHHRRRPWKRTYSSEKHENSVFLTIVQFIRSPFALRICFRPSTQSNPSFANLRMRPTSKTEAPPPSYFLLRMPLLQTSEKPSKGRMSCISLLGQEAKAGRNARKRWTTKAR
jgi:hypothetical protein